ncbi:MAG: enoyl-CoA hydratase/isomerase family protein [Alphaproteobacteria bacterium]|jgi:enoyl-CoA hydratase/carnithine racemase|nr:enoyl-CoA hydratase/isomerase family protein [Alphaproteobacteria bacterium]MBT4019084.1 enoyl-CoA hydratase/isomerase family protein [Alphaproteobacteria bacterium]MBT5160442.1 enoyl-CoA hydratase/isomerase family protein [Alphaproteobacteria bacterium]MBT5917815.1 enoyl-CoA hydratase/isomerase family protein [Alphaproteobacteria bacterium]MBT6388139.1 enoyl-CoA hydratase/isomerase family protein [Alphaproteobacteria bacterium]
MTDLVLHEVRDQAMWITINRPGRRNALNEDVGDGIIAGILAAEADELVRAIVITGAGDKAFCAGGDLKPSADGSPFDIDVEHPENFIVELFKVMRDCPLPTIARINGHALAGGLGLACACDMAVADPDALFGAPESKIGLYPMMIMPLLQRVLPRRKLMELCLTGEMFSAADALDMDLVNYVAEPGKLDEKLDWLLARTINKSLTAIRLGKMLFRTIEDQTQEAAHAYAQLMVQNMAQTDDAIEGFAAFNEKRKPDWKGR